MHIKGQGETVDISFFEKITMAVLSIRLRGILSFVNFGLRIIEKYR